MKGLESHDLGDVWLGVAAGNRLLRPGEVDVIGLKKGGFRNDWAKSGKGGGQTGLFNACGGKDRVIFFWFGERIGNCLLNRGTA